MSNILHRGGKREKRKDGKDQLLEREFLSKLCPEGVPLHMARKPGTNICSVAIWFSTKS